MSEISLIIGITFNERFKGTSVQFFIHAFNLLSCLISKFTFKLLY